MYLPLANILHHKLRSILSSMGIGIGICMLMTLTGLASGTLFEIADRWESVDADLIVFPHGWGDNAADKSGSALSDKYASILTRQNPDLVERVVPVFTWQIKLGGQDQVAAGVDPADWHTLTGGRKIEPGGKLYDEKNRFADWIVSKLTTSATAASQNTTTDTAPVMEITQQELAEHGGLELVIDTRLARAGHYKLGDTVTAANHQWKIVGIVPAGAMSRVFMPRRTAQYLFGNGDVTKSTLMFVKLKPGVDVGPAAGTLSRQIGQDAVPLGNYRGMLLAKFGIMFVYVDAANAVALTIAFLFIMVTLYTMVLQRTREIAILKSCGAGWAFIVRQVAAESLLLTALGTAIGIGLSFAAKMGIERFKPLLTVTISPRWIAIAIAVAAVGALVSAAYPAWRASRVDMAEALSEL